MMKREWRIPLVWSMYGTLNIEAETKEKAIALALGPDYPLPDNGVYLDDSIMVDLQECSIGKAQELLQNPDWSTTSEY